jgi:hypothetical protein
MRNKIKKILSMVLIGIIVGAIPAVADSLTWDQIQGANSLTACTSGQASYLYWIFTTGGGNPLGSEKLTINGNEYDGSIPSDDSSIVKFETPFYDLGTLTAHVDYDANILGNGNPNLVISHGCAGTTSIPEFPTVALPIAAILGLVFFFYQRKKKEI